MRTGSDGRCRVCGLASDEIPAGRQKTGEVKPPNQEGPSAEDARLPADEVEDETGIVDDLDGDASEKSWEDRIPCTDESCTGTIGTDGRCRLCGLAFDPEK